MAGQERQCQDDRQEQPAARAFESRLSKGPEGPGIPGGRPDVRIMALERVRQQERRSQIDAEPRPSPPSDPEPMIAAARTTPMPPQSRCPTVSQPRAEGGPNQATQTGG